MAAIVGLIGALVTLGPAWIVLSIVGFLGGYYRKAALAANSAAHRRQLDRERQAAEKRRRQDQLEWERRAPERMQAMEQEAERQKLALAQRDAAQKRRTKARTECEMLFQLYAPEIASRFSRESLDEWTTKYMGDDRTPEEVEEHGGQLTQIIIHHREQVKPTPRFTTLSQVSEWHATQKSEIDHLPVDERTRELLRAKLQIQFSEFMEQIMEGRTNSDLFQRQVRLSGSVTSGALG